MPARGLLGGFIPSNGVGTGYTREALAMLAQAHKNCIFDPLSLTEDYENGVRLKQLGCKQLFVPIHLIDGHPVATRELFPQRFRSALKQRTRWVMGNSMQAWERHGWRGGIRQTYWLWRDRKGIVGNPASALANLILAYGIVTWAWSRFTGTAWAIGGLADSVPMWLLYFTTGVLQVHRTAVRAWCAARIYGWGFASLVPVRTIWANWLNFFATASAGARYVSARLRSRPLVWLKTDHLYPSQSALMVHKRRLGEILVRGQFVEGGRLEWALAEKPAGVRIGEHLVNMGWLSEHDLYCALSTQQNVPFTRIESSQVPLWVARALPGAVARRWNVLPFRIAEGRMYVAGPELPSDEMQRQLRSFTRLEIRFQYVTPANFERLAEELLGKPMRKAS